MAKILLSIPDEVLEKIDRYKGRKKIKRSQFFLEAIDNYFKVLMTEEYFDRRKKAVERIKKTSKKIMKVGIKDWDPAGEIRKFRDERADELLKRWEEN
ncbi:MAG: hypothetical protein IMZ49_01570 [Actinobacteria bacterium]|nr:hypothetical protein [Actinomycetota bacterium]MBE3114381.1 hypothetical protein [Actinomycetota bacterium]MCJ7728165.1 hypothetical protein [Actinomycetota bacterium]